MIASAQAHVTTAIQGPEDVGAARRAARARGVALGIADALLAKVELAVTELGTNILHHAAGQGELLVQPVADWLGTGLEVLALDSGPGIVDVQRALAGRADSAEPPAALTVGLPHRRSLGCGLASVQRLATEFDLYTRRQQGTVVLARFLTAPRPPDMALDCAGVTVPIDSGGNGDAWGVRRRDDGLMLLVIDGLGHGARAAVAANAGLAAFHTGPCGDMLDGLRQVHEAMRATRGGAGCLCAIRPGAGELQFAGVGNVEGRVFVPGQRPRGMASRSGTLGMGPVLPRIAVVSHGWGAGATLVMHTDGIRRHFDFDAYPGLEAVDPAVVAGVLYRDLSRRRDDATVVVVRDRSAA